MEGFTPKIKSKIIGVSGFLSLCNFYSNFLNQVTADFKS